MKFWELNVTWVIFLIVMTEYTAESFNLLIYYFFLQDASVNASEWDMYDTYKFIEEQEAKG